MTQPPAAHPSLARLSGPIMRRLGSNIDFSTSAGIKTFAAKFREADDVLNSEGVGATGSVATVWLDTPDAVQLVEGDTFEQSGIGYRLAGERMDNGAGRSSFACMRTKSS